MAWIDDLDGKVVALDTAPLVYFIEEHPVYLPIVQPFFRALDAGRFQVITSTLTLLEVSVLPFRLGNQTLANLYETILIEAVGVTTLPVTAAIAKRAAALRAVQNIATPDAIQIATALEGGAAVFVTNDMRLKPVSNLNVMAIERLVAGG